MPAVTLDRAPVGDPALDAADANPLDASGGNAQDAWARLEETSPVAIHRRRWIVRLAQRHARSARHILQVACGHGKTLKRISLELPSAIVHGADASETALEAARRACPEAEVFRLDLEDPDFFSRPAAQRQAFDLVVAAEVLGRVPDDARTLARIGDLLTPGGHLVLTVPGSRPTRLERALGQRRRYTRRALERLLSEAGYDVEAVVAWGFPFHSLYRLVLRAATWNAVDASGAPRPPRPHVVLGHHALGALFRPLYYLNSSLVGPQLFAVARWRAPHGDAPGAS